jgi:hypothetical protein
VGTGNGWEIALKAKKKRIKKSLRSFRMVRN